MLDLIPIPLRAVFWPLAGALVLLTVRRWVPNFVGRVMAAAAAVASLMILWSLRTSPAESITLAWEPLNFFRMSPALSPDGLSLLVGIPFAWAGAAMLLGVRGTEPHAGSWHGLMLVVLAGGLVMTMATNLLTLALGSGLLDLAILALVVSGTHNASRVTWRIAVPGVISTGAIVLAALQMDTQIGTASLRAEAIPIQTLFLLYAAGLLRMLVFPVHPRGLNTAMNASLMLLCALAGIYVLARIQPNAQALLGTRWIVALGGAALVAGGLYAWAGAMGPEARQRNQPGKETQEDEFAHELDVPWPGLAMHQIGYALLFVTLAGTSVPWPLFSLLPALGILAIWHDAARPHKPVASPAWLQPPRRQAGSYLVRAQSAVTRALPALDRWAHSWLGRTWPALLPGLALACLAGVPLTAGAAARWRFYAEVLDADRALLVVAVLFADTFLVAALWTALTGLRRQRAVRRPDLGALVAMLGLAIPIVALGIAPGLFNLTQYTFPKIAPLGLAAAFLLPWFLGLGLARVTPQLGNSLSQALPAIDLDWFYLAIDRVSRRLLAGIHWFGQVGEGEGWFGWALIVLALGAMFLAAR